MHRPLVSVDWLKQNFDDPDLIILDASPISNMANLQVQHPGVRIVGARAFNLKDQFSNKESNLPNMIPSSDDFGAACRTLGLQQTSRLVVYDNLGIYASPRAWWMFKVMGHEKIAVLDGGLNAWISSGGKIEPISTRPHGLGDFVAKFDPDRIKHADQVLKNIVSEDFVVVDARSAGRFRADVPEPRADSRSGHIPGSYNLPYVDLCKDGKLLSKPELKAIFDKLGVGDAPLVFSCGSGMTACVNLLAADLVLENELALYDGSWSEWGDADGEWPVN